MSSTKQSVPPGSWSKDEANDDVTQTRPTERASIPPSEEIALASAEIPIPSNRDSTKPHAPEGQPRHSWHSGVRRLIGYLASVTDTTDDKKRR